MSGEAHFTPASQDKAAPLQHSHAGRVAVVTGASRGIGLAIARGLAQRGASVVAVALDDLADADRSLTELGCAYVTVQADVSKAADWQKIRDHALATFDTVDIVVNNAGITPAGLIDTLDLDQWHAVLRTNLDSVFLSAKEFAPQMVERGWGRFVNIASSSINSNKPGISHYMASKMGVIGFTRGLANDLGATGVTVNAVGPGLTRTAATASFPEFAVKAVVSRQAIPRMAEPQDIVGPVLFLSSEDAGFITGHTIMVDGGFSKP